MARINIEDSLVGDDRFNSVILAFYEKYGNLKLSKRLAIGEWYEIARHAQRYWIDGFKPIPKDIWDNCGFSYFFVDSGLVEKVEEGFYLKGSEEYFAWLIAKIKNSKKGGEATKNKYLRKPKKAENSPLTLSLSLTTNTKQPTSSDCEDDYSSSARKALGNKVCKNNDPNCRSLVQKFFEIYYPTKDIYTKTLDKYNPLMSEFIHSNNISYETMSAALDNKLKVQLLDKDIVFEAHQRQVSLKTFLDSFLKYHPDHFKIENFYDGNKQRALEDDKYVNIVNNLFAEEDKKRGVSK